MLPLIVVTGCNGQVGGEIQNLHSQYNDKYRFIFTTKNEIDLASADSIDDFFAKNSPQYFINCAAYTAVDKAENETELAKQVNALSVGLIAKHCAASGCKFIQVSTDYVFDGLKQEPYLPTDAASPINVYGLTKLFGEELALQYNPKTVVVRTSWVYNKTGKNFVNTMKRLMQEKESISVVSDQIGCPTYAPDLAEALLNIVNELETNPNKPHQNIYHYSNTGNISWHQFALQIKEYLHSSCIVNAIPTSAYPTPAKRSNYSVLDCSDIVNDFGVDIKEWKASLQDCLVY